MKAFMKAIGCGWRREDNVSDLLRRPFQHFALPSLLRNWPIGTGFATGHICIGELDLVEITTFEEVWRTSGAAFFKPINIPPGYFCLGYYGQSNTGSLDGSVVVAKENSSSTASTKSEASFDSALADAGKRALAPAVDYTLVWSSIDEEGRSNLRGYFWLPLAPDGYNPVGYIVTNTAQKPSSAEVMCVRADLTEACKRADIICSKKSSKSPFTVWDSYPCKCGKDEKAVAVGTFCCSDSMEPGDIGIACLKNTAPALSAMPTLDQIHALMSAYGPVFYFHPDETYFPSSLSWVFEQGALLYRKGQSTPEKIMPDGSNLSVDAVGEGECWVDLPNDGTAEKVMKGDLASAKVYVQVKPMMGGTFTDLVIWIYYPFNGPSTAKLGMVDLPLGKIGGHVSDWEHVTLRVSNFTGHLRKVYFAQHSGGYWVTASSLEYAHGNRPAVYASKHGHASYPHPGLVLQGDERIGVGIRNDTAPSSYILDAGENYEIVSAEYLSLNGASSGFEEPRWLHFTCEWGPKVQYDVRTELDNILVKLPKRLRSALETLIIKLPHELSGERGPTGPRLKNYWVGDERVKHH